MLNNCVTHSKCILSCMPTILQLKKKEKEPIGKHRWPHHSEHPLSMPACVIPLAHSVLKTLTPSVRGVEFNLSPHCSSLEWCLPCGFNINHCNWYKVSSWWGHYWPWVCPARCTLGPDVWECDLSISVSSRCGHIVSAYWIFFFKWVKDKNVANISKRSQQIWTFRHCVLGLECLHLRM